MDKRIDEFIGMLGELSAFLCKLKRRETELQTKARISETVENYLDGFSFQDSRCRCNVNDALQLNNKVKKVVLLTVKGDEELKKLKRGQGSVKLRIRYNKNGTVTKSYEGRYYDETGKVRSVYARTIKDCVAKLREANPIKKGTSTIRRHLTLKEWMLTWYNEFKKDTLRPTSKYAYEQQMNKYIFPAFGQVKLHALTTEKVQAFLNKISAGNTKRKLFLLLSACLKKAVVLKKIDFNVCDAVELPKIKKQKRRPFEYAEQNLLLSEKTKVSQAFFFLCATGLRVGEFLALTKDDFYFDQHFFKIDKAIAHGIPGEPKSESSNRVVYFTETLLENFDVELLGTYTYSTLKNAFSRLLKKHGIKGVSLHCTRHTFATVCHSYGVNDKVLQTILGHSTLAMTQDVYTHLLKKGSSKIGDYLSELCTYLRTYI